jgi:magnesium transporter
MTRRHRKHLQRGGESNGHVSAETAPTAGSPRGAPYIDHRALDDLAHAHLLPARARRRTLRAHPLGEAPLTNHNLLMLGDRAAAGRAFGSVALDMEQFAREQRQLATAEDADARLDTLVNSLEFGGSNPLLSHSSDSTSLDDVCFPDYYDVEDGARGDLQAWPDLKVLGEFVREELAEAQEDYFRPQDPEVTFPGAKEVLRGAEAVLPGTVLPGTVLPGTALSAAPHEATPLLSKRVNEIEGIATHALRVRPPPVTPWDMTRDMVPILRPAEAEAHEPWPPKLPTPQAKRLTVGNKIDPSLCRYTYFREDLDKTIHSPTISGLLGKAADDVHRTLEDLFLPHFHPRRPQSSSAPRVRLSKVLVNLQASAVGEDGDGGGSAALVLRFPQMTPIGTDDSTAGEANPFWLDVLDPTEEEMKVLSKTFGIHPLTTEDIFLGEAREKVELFKLYYFICFTSFDVVHERRKQKAKEHDKRMSKLQDMAEGDDTPALAWQRVRALISGASAFERRYLALGSGSSRRRDRSSSSTRSRAKKVRDGELLPLNMYMIVFKDAVITFHFSATPHPINVRRRARMLQDYLTVLLDWICYALIDDITDLFAPMIESIEAEVNAIEDAILKMHLGDTDSDDDSSDSDSDSDALDRRPRHPRANTSNVFFTRKRTKLTVEGDGRPLLAAAGAKSGTLQLLRLRLLRLLHLFKIIGWKRKGDMLRRIGECRKRVMSILRLLGSKADVIKGFSKRYGETERHGLSKVEIEMYLGDIQDHIVTMVQLLNHYEKLLARFHSNYLAQINIDMTKVNNDTNDVLGKITILGTIVLPINVVTGLWGMNCIVPGQDLPGLTWFYSIVGCMALFSLVAYNFAKRVTGL